ncbi:DNA topoisomerase IB [Novosphingobium sp. 9]|uniref:DNA topoisomerase IB n=1 Tax=Novosphingobium sp. 9 TaxID=2025349 RepID=UPI0021B64FC6|nr:DNA topoisomerase IB [Novosphingobium sp. 9]
MTAPLASAASPRPLRFGDDAMRGITRRRTRAGRWAFDVPDGAKITDRAEIARLMAIALPPAYKRCWYSPDPEVHLLATGYDARGRKQYRYHPDWRAQREARKFAAYLRFGAALPGLRAQVARDLAARRFDRARAVASVVALLDTGAIRVGNECYARANRSFGATTLRNRHASITGRRLHLRFRGKGGRMHEIDSEDAALVRCVRRMQDLPGQHLFQYLDEDGAAVPVHSEDVNAYLAQAMGTGSVGARSGEEGFTAGDFRTFTASALAFGLLCADPRPGLGAMLEVVSARLGNTPAIARKSYVHPLVIALAKGEETGAALIPKHLPRRTRWMSREERGLLAFLGQTG